MAVDFPYLNVAELVVLLDGETMFKDGATLFEVTAREDIPAMPHNAIALLSGGAAAPAGYTLDANALASTTVAAAGQSARIAPLCLQADQFQLAEWRPRFEFINIDAGVVADDLSVLAFSGNQPRWATQNVIGEVNPIMQMADPVDPALAPARGASQAQPTSFSATEPSTWAPALWSYYTRFQIGFQLQNRGVNPIGANGTFAWLMRARGYVYNLTAYPLGPSPDTVTLGGSQVQIPHDVKRTDVRVIQMTGRPPKAAPTAS